MINRYDMEDVIRGKLKGIFPLDKTVPSWTSAIIRDLQQEVADGYVIEEHRSSIILGGRMDGIICDLVKHEIPSQHVPTYTNGIGCTIDEVAKLMDLKKNKKRKKHNRVPVFSRLNRASVIQRFGDVTSMKDSLDGKKIDMEFLRSISDEIHDNIDDFMHCEIIEYNCDLLVLSSRNPLVCELKLSGDVDKKIHSQILDNLILPYLALGRREADVIYGIIASNQTQKDLDDIFAPSGKVVAYTPPSGLNALSNDMILVERDLFKKLFGDEKDFDTFQDVLEIEIRAEMEKFIESKYGVSV